MGAVSDAFDSAFRDYKNNGDPASGVHNPVPEDCRNLGGAIETEINAISSGVLSYTTKALMDADTGQDDGTLAYVTDDTATSNNGIYRSASGAWTKTALQFLSDTVDGLSVNSGKPFPLRQETLNSTASAENTDWSNFILDITVHDANPLYWYRLARHYGPTHSSRPYAWWIERHLKAAYATEHTSELIQHWQVAGPSYTTSGVQSIALECEGFSERVTITIDASQHPGSGTIDSQSDTKAGYSWIIDPVKYELSVAATGSLALNSGAIFPMENRTRDGLVYGVSAEARNAFVDCQIYGARPGKLYKIEYVANNNTGQGDEDKYTIIVAEYDAATFGSDSASSNFELIGLDDQDNSTIASGDTITRTFVCAQGPDITVRLTYSPGEISGTTLNMSTAGDDYGLVIDPANYHPVKLSAGALGNNVLVRRSGDVLDVIWQDPGGAYDFKYSFQEFGRNNLMQFGVQYQRAARLNLNILNAGWDDDWTTLFPGGATGTDWMGPIVVEATASTDGNTAVAFTGGNHIVPHQTGDTSAQTVSFEFINADTGAAIRDGEELVADRVLVRVHNEIAAYNTIFAGSPRYVLDEHVTYSVTRYGCAAACHHRAREAVDVTTYYGLQSAPLSYWGATTSALLFRHSDDLSRQTWNDTAIDPAVWSSFGDLDGVVLTKSGEPHLVTWLDTSFGAADGTYVDKDNEPRFFASESKIYANMINPASAQSFSANDTWAWRGAWLLTRANASGSIAGYWLRDVEGRYVFLADALSADDEFIGLVPPGAEGLDLEAATKVSTGSVSIGDQPAAGEVFVSASTAASLTVKV